jgi:hypothetical protein
VASSVANLRPLEIELFRSFTYGRMYKHEAPSEAPNEAAREKAGKARRGQEAYTKNNGLTSSARESPSPTIRAL